MLKSIIFNNNSESVKFYRDKIQKFTSVINFIVLHQKM